MLTELLAILTNDFCSIPQSFHASDEMVPSRSPIHGHLNSFDNI
jgi:hypothetical protein